MASELRVDKLQSTTSPYSDAVTVASNANVTIGSLNLDTGGTSGIKTGTLNSKKYLNHHYFGSSYYLSTVGGSEWNNQSWMEVAKQSVSAIAWSKSTTTGASGSDDADQFGKFVDGSNTGRWTPTISGYYLVSYTIIMGLASSGNMFQSTIRVNGATTRGVFAFVKNYSAVTPWQVCNTATAIVPLDTNDYFSLWVYQDSAAARAIQTANPSTTQMSITYVGASDL